LITTVHSSSTHRRGLPTLEQVEQWLSRAVDRSSRSSTEDLHGFATPSSLADFFAEHSKAVQEGKIRLRPVAERRARDRRNMDRLENSGPYILSVEVEP
jgi:hypothetical protein